MGVQDNQTLIVQEFTEINDWSERYQKIIQCGKDFQCVIKDELKTGENKIKGCQSQVWLHAELDDGNVIYSADSDALIIRGMVALLLRVYSGQSPSDIINNPPSFLSQIGMDEHLSPNRRNGLEQIVRQIQFYAIAFQSLLTNSLK